METVHQSNTVDSAVQTKDLVRRRKLAYLVLGIGLTVGYAALRGLPWQGSATLHTVMEAVATCLAILVGAMALVRYYSRPNNTFLILGAGFLGTGFLDGYHALVTSAWIKDLLPSDLPSLIPWSWVASRLFLSVVLWLSYVAWRRESRLGAAGRVSERFVYACAILATLISFVTFAFVPLPRAYYPEFVFHRPEEFLPAAFFAIALAGYLSKGVWRHDSFEHWLVLALIVNLIAQSAFMSFSGQLFDLEFDAAHTLKKLSYILVLIGLLISMYATFRQVEAEIAERKAAERALIDAREIAEKANLAKSSFLAVVSHEIRTPLNAVLGMAELLEDSDMCAEQRERVRTIRRSGKGLLDLINDILDFSKVEAGRLVLEHIDFDLERLVNEVARLMAPKAQAKGVEIIVDVPAACPRHVTGDPGRLRQVLVNLAGNAVKFTDSGHIVLAVRAQALDDDRARLRVEVHDTGIGITADAQSRLFMAFTQEDGSTTRRYGGTGLGLAISQEFVGLMGGRIEVRSAQGKGSTFAFSIEVPVAEPPGPIAKVALEGVRALIVDDNAIIRRILVEQTRSFGMHADAVEGPTPALLRLRDAASAGNSYDVVLSDHQMPDRDGVDLVRAIRSDPAMAEIPLMMLTSSGIPGDAAQVRKAGAGGYLVKPVERPVLQRALVALLDGQASGARDARFVTRHLLAEVEGECPASEESFSGRVLVAEDVAANRTVARAMLGKLGVEVVLVEDGEQAVERWAEGDIDLIFMDLRMPNMDGLAAASEIRAREAGSGGRVPIVALTADALPERRIEVREAGMDDFVTKPFEKGDLAEVLNRCLGRRAPARTAPDAVGAPVEKPTDESTHRASPPALDPRRLASMRENLGEDFDEFINAYVEGVEETLEQLAHPGSEADLAEVRRLAHGTKGASWAAGATRLAELAEMLEDQAREDRLENLPAQVEAMRSEFERVRELLDVQAAL